MVAWYSPLQLCKTAVQVILSTAFGRYADRRVLDALRTGEDCECDYSAEDDFWLDYVADTGDGFNPTYAVAYWLSRPELTVASADGTSHRTQRGRVLVLGGDAVYPTSSRAAYEQRLVGPYRTALAQSSHPHPTVFAVPGNHDWYDGLVAFTRLFSTDRERWFGGWETRQRRSYFVLRLPHGWWVVGTDVQLDSDIDEPQLEYFRTMAAKIPAADRIVLCTAEPHWIYEARYSHLDPTITQRNLRYLEREVFGKRVAVFVAGDLHYYQRHTHRDGRQKITCGGGGAFLHPTHPGEDEVRKLPDEFELAQSYPTPTESRRLAWRNLLFPVLNPTFGLATALGYLLFAWAVFAQSGMSAPTSVSASLLMLARNQVALFWVALMLAGFYLFTDTHDKRFRISAGLLHALSHLACAFVLGWTGAYLAHLIFPQSPWGQLATTLVVVLVGGYFAGAFILGLYLLISLNLFGRHANEAFSSLRIQDYKCWLRLHVSPDGLSIYPIGLRRVPRRWTRANTGGAGEQPIERPMVEPDDARATTPSLIEPPVRLQQLKR